MTKKRIRKVARGFLLTVLSLPFLGAMVFTALAGLAWLEDQSARIAGHNGHKPPVFVTPVAVESGNSVAKVPATFDVRKINSLIDMEAAQLVAAASIPWWPSAVVPTTLVRIHFDESERDPSIEQDRTHQGL
jgi:hypothetical protein